MPEESELYPMGIEEARRGSEELADIEYMLEMQNKLPESFRFDGPFGAIAREGYYKDLPEGQSRARISSYVYPSEDLLRENAVPLHGYYISRFASPNYRSGRNKIREDLESRGMLSLSPQATGQEGVNIYYPITNDYYDRRGRNASTLSILGGGTEIPTPQGIIWHELTHRGLQSDLLRDFAYNHTDIHNFDTYQSLTRHNTPQDSAREQEKAISALQRYEEGNPIDREDQKYIRFFNDFSEYINQLPVEQKQNGGPAGIGSLPEYEERGITGVLTDFMGITQAPQGLPALLGNKDMFEASGYPTYEGDYQLYEQADPTFFERLVNEYGYPEEVMQGPREGLYARPEGRPDLPSHQELTDARRHMLASAVGSLMYGPDTAKRLGDFQERFFAGENKLYSEMDVRNNAVGVNIFKQAGIESTPQELTRMVDQKIFDQLDVILGRKQGERGPTSPTTGPELYFPRDQYGRTISAY